VTSTTKPSARLAACPPGAAARHWATAASTASLRRSQTITVAPSRANLSAVARPMPWAAPVTMQILCWSHHEAWGFQLKEFEHVGQVGVEVAQRMVAAFDQADPCTGVARAISRQSSNSSPLAMTAR
jgi:hypothetical protein